MARRSKRVVKQRAKAHQKLVKRERRRRKRSKRRVGYGARKRHAKKSR
jgi:hypothetical protein